MRAELATPRAVPQQPPFNFIQMPVMGRVLSAMVISVCFINWIVDQIGRLTK
jgi:hypothetical protein